MGRAETAKLKRIKMAQTAPFLHLLSKEDRKRFLKGEIKIAEKASFYCEKCDNYYQISINAYKNGRRCSCERYAKASKTQIQRSVNNTPKEVISAMHPDDRERFLKCEIKNNKKVRFYCNKCGNYHEMQINNYKQGQRCPCDKWAESSKRQVKAALDKIPQEVLDAMHPQDKEILFKGETTQHSNVRFKCEHCGEWFEMTTLKYKSGQRCSCQKHIKIATTRKANSAKEFKHMDVVHPEDREKMYQGILGISEKIRFWCDKCGEYFLMTGLKYNAGQRCPICAFSKSSFSFLDFLKTLDVEVEVNNRRVIDPLEIDFYLPRYKIGFEFNDLLTHKTPIDFTVSRWSKNAVYHYNKYQKAKKQNVILIHIWDIDWANKKKRKSIKKGIVKLLEGEMPRKEHKNNVMKFYEHKTRKVVDYHPSIYKEMCKKCMDGKATRYYTCGLYWEAN